MHYIGATFLFVLGVGYAYYDTCMTYRLDKKVTVIFVVRLVVAVIALVFLLICIIAVRRRFG